ncbi:hypothetical protein VPH35_044082 [Triticum aestivum]
MPNPHPTSRTVGSLDHLPPPPPTPTHLLPPATRPQRPPAAGHRSCRPHSRAPPPPPSCARPPPPGSPSPSHRPGSPPRFPVPSTRRSFRRRPHRCSSTTDGRRIHPPRPPRPSSSAAATFLLSHRGLLPSSASPDRRLDACSPTCGPPLCSLSSLGRRRESRPRHPALPPSSSWPASRLRCGEQSRCAPPSHHYHPSSSILLLPLFLHATATFESAPTPQGVCAKLPSLLLAVHTSCLCICLEQKIISEN